MVFVELYLLFHKSSMKSAFFQGKAFYMSYLESSDQKVHFFVGRKGEDRDMSWMDGKGTSQEILETYFGEYSKYQKVQREAVVLKAKIQQEEKDLAEINRELEQFQQKEKMLEQEVNGNSDLKRKNYQSECDREIDKIYSNQELTQAQLDRKRQADIQTAQRKRDHGLEEAKDNKYTTLEQLTKEERTAYEFAVQKQEVEKETNDKTYNFQQQLEQVKSNYEKEIDSLKSERQSVADQYRVPLEQLKGRIEAIEARYEAPIEELIGKIQEAAENRDIQISNLQETIRQEEQDSVATVKGMNRERDAELAQMEKEIRNAEKNGQPTSLLISQKNKRSRELNKEIQGKQNNFLKRIREYENRIEKVSSGYDKEYSKLKAQLDEKDAQRLKELSEPQASYEAAKTERDTKFQTLNQAIKDRETQRNQEIEQLQGPIDRYEAEKKERLAAIDQKIRDYAALSTEGRFHAEDVEAFRPFAGLKSHVDGWNEVIGALAKQDSKLSERREKTYKKLQSLDYQTLKAKAEKMANLSEKVPLLSRYMMVALAVETLFFLWWIGYTALNSSMKKAVCVTVLMLVAWGFTYSRVYKALGNYLEAVLLAESYSEIGSIRERADQNMIDAEFQDICFLGERIYHEIGFCAHIQEEYEKQVNEIDVEYRKNVEKLHEESEKGVRSQEQILQAKIKGLDAAESENRKTISQQLSKIQRECERKRTEAGTVKDLLDKDQGEERKQMQAKEKFMEGYREFRERLRSMQGNLGDNGGVLSNSIYLIPTALDQDPLPICKVTHNRQPMIVLYDDKEIENMSNISDARKRLISQIQLDLLQGFYLVNDKNLTEQYIVDEVSGGEEVAKDRRRYGINGYGWDIKEVREAVLKLKEDKREMAEKSENIDAINRKNYVDKERPRPYQIFYFIYKSDNNNKELDEDIRQLMAGGSECGFLPVFVCEMKNWNESIEKGDGRYARIKESTQNQPILYQNQMYTIQ